MMYMYQFLHKYLTVIFLLGLFALIGCRDTTTADKDIVVDSNVIYTTADRDIVVDSNVIYTIGDLYTLTFQDVDAYARSLGVHLRYEDALYGYTKIMQELVGNQYKRFDFFDQKLHEKQEIMLLMQRYIHEELAAAWYEHSFVGKYLTDEYLRASYEKMKYEVTYRQIVLFDNNSAGNDAEPVDEIVQHILKSLENGEDFSRLVNRYSQDIGSHRTGGYAPAARWNTIIQDPVHAAIFTLNPGSIEVIRHINAVYIVQIISREQVYLAPFEEMKSELVEQVRTAYLQKSFEEYEHFLEQLVSESNLEWNEQAILLLVDWSRQPGFFRDKQYRDYIVQELNKGNNFEILLYADGTVNLEKLLFLLDNVLSFPESQTFTPDVLKDYLVTALRIMKVGELAKEAGLLEEVFNPVTTNWALSNEILIAYNNHVIDNQIPDPTPERLMAFYEEVKDSLFYQLRTVYTHIIAADNESQVQDLKSKFMAGMPFTELAHRINVRVFYRDRDGKVHVRNTRPQPEMTNIVINLEEGDVAGPVYFHHPERGRVPALVWAKRILPEKQLNFEEVSDRIEKIFREHQRAKINERVISNIRENYESRFFEEHLVQNLRDRGLL